MDGLALEGTFIAYLTRLCVGVERLADATERLVDLIEATAEDELEPPPLPQC